MSVVENALRTTAEQIVDIQFDTDQIKDDFVVPVVKKYQARIDGGNSPSAMLAIAYAEALATWAIRRTYYTDARPEDPHEEAIETFVAIMPSTLESMLDKFINIVLERVNAAEAALDDGGHQSSLGLMPMFTEKLIGQYAVLAGLYKLVNESGESEGTKSMCQEMLVSTARMTGNISGE